ncbi:hypothetical protein D3OALGB2SA_2936 [Olavius algarvensis associated proteobacterium Delta 3]|nr:hypothetical protein D3OALGB2SA_2936 [Olavius algarvensis associated proteobacterium Delta 3]
MHLVKPDPEKNRLYITIGEANRVEIEAALESVEVSCKKVTAGFTCIFHFTEGALLLPSDQDLLFKIQGALVSGRLQLEMLHMNSSCPATNALTLDEAEIILNNGKPSSA